MANYIDREKYCNEICHRNQNYCDKQSCPIWEAPSEDVAPVVHAHWIDWGTRNDDGNGEYTCSRCGHNDEHSHNIRVPYCWYCGAKVDAK